jgi:hypothetical protein
MKLLKFKEFLNEDIVPLGFGMSSRPSYYTLSSSQIRTGYDMQAVAGPMVTASDSVANSAIDHENNDNPDHTGRGYINEALKVFKEKCNEAYESKCNEALKESGIDTSRYKRSHGKNPTGFGGWGFFFDNDKEPVFTPNAMNYADAVKWAKGKAKELGKTTIYVAESSDINEANKFSSSGFTFSIMGNHDSKGSYISFLPDGKTVDTYSKEEMAAFIEKYFNNMDYFRDCMEWDNSHSAAGLVFRINAGYLADSLLKEFKN